MVGLVVFILIVVVCLLAPLYAHDIAHMNPFASNIQGTFRLNGRDRARPAAEHPGLGVGRDADRADVELLALLPGRGRPGSRRLRAAPLRRSQQPADRRRRRRSSAASSPRSWASPSGYFGGPVDWVLSRVFDIIWAFPIYLLAISLSVVLLTSGLQFGPFHIGPGSLLLPILIIASVFVPYVARPLRGIVHLATRARVHPIGHRLGRVGLSDPDQGDPAQRRAEHHRLPAADGGFQHAHRVGAVVPGHRRAAPGGQLGHDHQRRTRAAVHTARVAAWRRDS